MKWLETIMRYLWPLAVVATCTAQNVALLATNRPPQGETFTFAWDASQSVVDGYRVYTTTNKTDWKQVAQTTNLTATVSNIFAPCWWVCRSYRGTNESTNSNRIGYLGVDTVVTVTAQSSSNLTKWVEFATIFKGTNPPGMSFFRTYSAAQTFKRFE